MSDCKQIEKCQGDCGPWCGVFANELKDMFTAQQDLQYQMFRKVTPVDSPQDYAYSMLGMLGEMGEVLAADKRWKNSRNDHVSKEDKLEEICDVFAFAINMVLYSGFDYADLYIAFMEKNQKNIRRIDKDK